MQPGGSVLLLEHVEELPEPSRVKARLGHAVVFEVCGSGESGSTVGVLAELLGAVMRVRTLIVVLASGALVVAACGSRNSTAKSSSEKHRPATTTTKTPSSTPPSRSALVDAQRRAQASLLVPSDFPPGWTSTPYVKTPDTPTDTAQSRQLANCLGVPNRDVNGSGDIHGLDFALGQKFKVNDSASVTRSEAEATQVLDAIKGPKFIPCFQPFATNDIKTGLAKTAPTANVGNVTVKRLDLPKYGDATAAIGVSVPLSGPGGQTTVYVDFVLVRSGQVGLEDVFSGVGQPIDRALEQHLVAKASDRLTGKQPPVATSSV